MCREIVENVLSGTKAGFNNLVFNQKAKKVKMKIIIRSIVDNVLSGTKAGFKAIRNLVFNQKKERKKMENLKSKSTFSAILLSLTLMVAVLGVSPAAMAAEMVKDPTTGEMVEAPQYGGTLTYAHTIEFAGTDPWDQGTAPMAVDAVAEKLAIANWGIDRDEYGFTTRYVPLFAFKGNLAESWETPNPTTIVLNIRKGVCWHNKAPMNGRELTAQDIDITITVMRLWAAASPKLANSTQ